MKTTKTAKVVKTKTNKKTIIDPIKIVENEFSRQFKYFSYPFEKADEQLRKMTELERQKYLQDIHTFVESAAYKAETQEIVRLFYQELATKPLNNIETTGYRLALIAIKRLDERLLYLNQEYYRQEKVIELNEVME